jgi:putative peptide zinc metalloprotease protein
MLLCEIPTQNENNPARYAIPKHLVELLKMFDGEREPQAIVEEYERAHPGSFPASKLRWLVYQYWLPKGLLVDTAVAYEHLEPPPNWRRGYLYLKVGLLSQRTVAKFTALLSWLFMWPVFFSLLPVFVITHVLFYTMVMPHYHFNLNSITGYDFFVLSTITSVFGLFHELGHASALCHYGSKRTSIGWGLYIIFTVFYTDLSDSWRFKRVERAMVDLGGIYFHCVSLILLLAATFLTGWPMLVYCFFFIDLQIASSFNPFLRMDGYWLIADLFGITDLRKQSLGMMERLGRRLIRSKSAPVYPVVPLKPIANAFLTVYSIFGIGFFLYLYKIMFFQIVFRLLPMYPKMAMEFWHTLMTTPGYVFTLLNLFTGILWKTFALFGLFLFAWRLLQGFLKAVARARRNHALSLERSAGAAEEAR